MNRKEEQKIETRTALFVGLIYLISSVYIFYIGRFETIYGSGVLGAIALQLIGLVIFVISLLLTSRKFRKSLLIAALSLGIIQAAIIVFHEIKEYSPTYTINIPTHYEGCIYLFVTNAQRSDVVVDQNGIGYVGSHGKASWKIFKGGQDVTSAFSTSQQNEILIHDSTNNTLTSYNVSCMNINPLNVYAKRHSDYEIIPCMDYIEFLELVKLGIIDEQVLRKTVWKRQTNDSNWMLDAESSRI